MKTWTVTRNTPAIVLGMTTETLTVRSFDDPDQAASEILSQLGFVVTPCCDVSDDEPCERCREELALTARLRAEEGH